MKMLNWFFLITLAGCSHLEIFKGFKPTSQVVSDDVSINVTVRMVASNIHKSTTIFGEPYTLIVDVFYTENLSRIELGGLDIKGSGGDQIILVDKGIDLKEKQGEQRHSATFRYELENLAYEAHEISGRLLLIDGGVVSSNGFSIILETDYKEERINKIWGNLMGI